jgi:hypothetical protein
MRAGDAIPQNHDSILIARSLINELLEGPDASATGELLYDALCEIMPAPAWNDIENSEARLLAFSRILGAAVAVLVQSHKALRTARRRPRHEHDENPMSDDALH